MKTGITASVGLLLLYGVAMTLFNGWSATVEQFRLLWWLMVPLSIGFGVQVGLYTKLKKTIQEKAKTTMTTSSTVSGVAIVACCAHHATDVLPFLGLAGLGIFLTRYQAPILGLSIVINGIGIAIMLKHLKKITL